MNSKSPRIVAIDVKTTRGGPMREVDSAEVVRGGGIAEGAAPSAKRGVTFLSREAWEAALREVNADLPWHARRANVLVEGLDLADMIGRSIRIGTAEFRIGGETKPCPRMDREHPGLQDALRPDCRAGVYGRVMIPGRFQVGDPVTTLD